MVRNPAQRTLLLCSRSAGKSTAAAALAIVEALTKPAALVLILSPSEKQSGEMMLKVKGYYAALGKPAQEIKETDLQLCLVGGSRVIALPGNEKTVRTYNGVSLLIIDEASRVEDPLYHAVTPMVSVSKGRILALSTPFGQRGWFWDEWSSERAWERVKVKASECPRIPASFLAEERQRKGRRWFDQEYECSFESAVDAVFDPSAIAQSMRDDIAPLWE